MNKILIFAPKSEDAIIASFPFIHLVDEKLNPSEINIIDSGVNSKLYQVLPFKVNLWSIPEDQYSFLGIHKYSKNLHDVFNITHFFDLRGEFLSQWTGKCFAAVERVGEEISWWSKIFLNNSYKNIGKHGHDLTYVNLLGQYMDDDVRDFKLFNKDQFGNDKVEVTKLLFLIDRIDKKEKYFNFWLNSFDHFKKTPMTMVLYQASEEGHEFLDKAKDKLEEMVAISMTLPEETFDLLKASKVVVTTNRWFARMATYFSKECFLITDNIRQYPYGHHFPKGVNLLEFRDGEVHMAVLEDSEEILDQDIEWTDLYYKQTEAVIDT